MATLLMSQSQRVGDHADACLYPVFIDKGKADLSLKTTSAIYMDGQDIQDEMQILNILSIV